ncbi:MAG: crossover junction endodeoxyribonuclease RuvC [Candidatus Omnitrophica bacterium]|nr:crossover junction endodeoxyribonuclease RuvC [Candidatus Omnitrophota bacterium]
MIILGIDPALAITGYGVIQADKRFFNLLEAGVISTSPKEVLAKRLDKIYTGITKLIDDTKPDVAVLEKLYAHYAHPTTAFILGHARGVITLACAKKNIPVFEYAATRVKKAIVGRGLASKAQVQSMVVNILNLDSVPKFFDVTDALALAISHSYISRLKI